MTDLNKSTKKLIQALNLKGYKLLYSRRQFFSKDAKVQTMYVISQGRWNAAKDRYDSVEIYKTPSLIRIVLFLRDMLFIEEGKPLPQDNEYWNQCREYLKGRGIGPYGGNSISKSQEIPEPEDENFRD